MNSKILKLTLEYDGTDFSGWQTQPNKRTVQTTLEEAFKRLIGKKVAVVGAGRTDAGVHAMGQVAHVVIPETSLKSFKDLRYSLNSVLPDDVSVLKIERAPKGFHAIRSAKKKIYVYQIWNSPVKPALDRRTVWPIWEKLDLAAMKKGTKPLLGEHDFSAFEGAQASTVTKVRTIFDIKIKNSHKLILIEFCGSGFLKHMVRNIVGTLVEVGRGRRKPEELSKIIKSKDRRKAGQTAPPQGLFLKKIYY